MTYRISKFREKYKCRFSLYILCFILVMMQTASAQDDLVLENQEINTSETYEAANSITAGNGFTIMNTGKVTFKSGNRVYLKPGFTVLKGGTFDVMLDETYGPVSQEEFQIPAEFKLGQNYPNPFNPRTNIEFRIPKAEFVTLTIYDIKGQKAKRLIGQELSAGVHQYQFDGNDLASGIYYYEMVAGEYREVRKMILLK